MEFKGSKTEQNLINAFAGESQARNRYTYYAEIARKEGLEHVAAIFEETAWNERAHAQVFFEHLTKNLGNAKLVVNGDYPVFIGTTAENLKAAADGENEEYTVLYNNFSKIAEEEGFKAVAHSFKEIAEVEEEHEKRYLALWNLVKENKYFTRDEEVIWKCRNCGYVHVGKEAPKACHACRYPQSYFEIKEHME